MAVGFIVASVIAAACMFTIGRTTQTRSNVQAFAAAEAGRDAVVAALTSAPTACSDGAVWESDDPQYEVEVYSTDSTTSPQGIAGTARKCPTTSSNYVVLRVTGTASDGGESVTIETVYRWEGYREQVAGGGLGFMDAAYTAYAVDYSGDIVVRNGNFTCAAGTEVDGSVYVLNGRVVVPAINLLLITVGTECTITGDVVTKTGIDIQNGTIPNSRLTVGGNVSTPGALSINDPLIAGGDVEAGTITVASSGSLSTKSGAVKPDGTTARGNIAASGAISASGSLSTAGGSIVSNTTVTASASVKAADSVSAVQAITVTGSGSVEGTAGGVASGGAITVSSSGSVRGGSVTAKAAISGGTVQATAGDVTAGTTISGGTISAARDVRAVGAISGGTVTAARDILTPAAVSGGTITAGRDLLVSGAITGGTITATRNIRAGATIDVGTGSATASTGSIEAVGTISARTGSITATQGSIRSNGDILITGAGGRLSATSTGASIAAGGAIDLMGTSTSVTGQINAYDVTAVGAFKTRAACAIGGNVLVGGVVQFAQPTASDSTSTKCQVQGYVRSASTTASTLPVPGSGTSSRVQVWVRGGVQSRATSWSPATGRYRDLNNSNTGSNTVAPTSGASVTAPASPNVTAPTEPAANTVPAAPTVYEFPPIDFAELFLRTQWVDLGTHTNWNGYTDRRVLTTGECSSARTIVSGLVSAAGAPVLIDATACRSITLTGWSSLNLRRDAVILANDVSMQFIRFTQSGATSASPRQLFIVQVDDDLTLSAAGEPQPTCNIPGQNRKPISIFGNSWFGLSDWDPLVRVLLYSPCGSNNTNVLSDWRGHLYVANDSATTDVIGSVTCERMVIPGTFDLPCSVNDFGEWSGHHTQTGKRMGPRLYQTEP